jgi:hypothetical protein
MKRKFEQNELTGGHTVEYIPTEVGKFYIVLYRNVPYNNRMLK